jgi:hypothetical protein
MSYARNTTENRKPILRPIMVALALFLGGIAASAANAPSAMAAGAPTAMTAWYMFATTTGTLNSDAYSDGYHDAGQVPSGTSQYLIIDFGQDAVVGNNTYGAYDFSGVTFSNSQILTALENASNGVHDGYRTGFLVIVYGNNNDNLTGTGMTHGEVYNSGYYQEQRAGDLASYQSTNGRIDQGAAAGSDMELDYDTYAETSQLVAGASSYSNPYDYLDYGSAEGCPPYGNCDNNWTVSDVVYVSFYGAAVPVPEIYNITANAQQWQNIRETGDNEGYSYFFLGVTGNPPASTAQSAWNQLNSDTSGDVLPELVCFGC